MTSANTTADTEASQALEPRISNLERASAYAAQGLAVFPVWGINAETLECLCGGLPSCNDGDNAGKHPITANGHKQATTKAKQIKVWWQAHPEANIGLATGEKSGIVVLDVDGSAGVASLNGRKPADTLTVTTGREDGGTHYWYRHPGFKVKNSIKLNGLPGLDIRGDGGYVIVPPSLHASGNHYQWGSSEGFNLDAVAGLPEWLAKLIQEDSKSSGPTFRPTIPDGERNDTLFREACALKNRGADLNAILSYLRARNLQCQTPLSDEELIQIAESAERYDPSPTLTKDRHTDVGNGKRLVHLYGHELRYLEADKKWLHWDGKRWSKDSPSRVRYFAVDTLRQTFDVAIREQDQALAQWVRDSEKNRHIDYMMTNAIAEPGIPISPEELDADPWLFNVSNAVIDLRTGEGLTHSPGRYMTKLSRVEFDPEATCPRWEQFLTEIIPAIEPTEPNPDDPDDTGSPGRSTEESAAIIGYLQRLVGYSLTGEATEQTLTFLYGGGGNGKTTFIETIAALLGEYWVKTPTQTLMRTRNSDEKIRNDLARLRGARMVVANEITQGGKLDEATVKDLTGTDHVTARFLHGEFFQFKPSFTLLMYGNHKPIINGTDEGIWRRVHLVPFTASFRESRDNDLNTKLLAELPGILNWAIQGARDWQEQGLNPPASIIAETEAYRDEMNRTKQFVEEATEPADSNAKVPVATLHQAYRGWCSNSGYTWLGAQNFGEELTKLGIKSKKSNSKNYRVGITLSDAGWRYHAGQEQLGNRGN
jgi:putative DNA primase/helicase